MSWVGRFFPRTPGVDAILKLLYKSISRKISENDSGSIQDNPSRGHHGFSERSKAVSISLNNLCQNWHYTLAKDAVQS
jgi:hypothetical protein